MSDEKQKPVEVEGFVFPLKQNVLKDGTVSYTGTKSDLNTWLESKGLTKNIRETTSTVYDELRKEACEFLSKKSLEMDLAPQRLSLPTDDGKNEYTVTGPREVRAGIPSAPGEPVPTKMEYYDFREKITRRMDKCLLADDGLVAQFEADFKKAYDKKNK